MLINPMRIITKRNLQNWTGDLNSHLILPLAQLMHLGSLLIMTVDALCKASFKVLSFLSNLGPQILNVEKVDQLFYLSRPVNQFDWLQDNIDIHVYLEISATSTRLRGISL